MTDKPALDRRSVLSLAAAMTAITVLGTTIGLVLPVVAIALDARGVSETMVGVNTSAQFVGIMLFSLVVPRLMVRIGLLTTMNGAILLSSAVILLMPVFDGFWAWAGLRFLLGCAEATLFVTGETWINQVADDRVRGRVLGLYGSLLAGGIAIGPLIVEFTGTAGALPFIVGGLVPLIALVPLILAARIAPQFTGAPTRNLWRLLAVVPLAGVSAIVFGLLDSSVIGLLPIYGLDIGRTEAEAARLLTLLVLGQIMLQLPIGWVADRMNRFKLMGWTTLIGTTGLLIVPLTVDHDLPFTLLLFMAGGVIGATWTLTMILLGQTFSGLDLAAMNVVVAILYGAGSIIGPPIAGAAMSVWPPHGLTLALAVPCLVLSVYAFATAHRRARLA